MKLTTISSIMGAIIFGFSSILFSSSSTIVLFNNTNDFWITSDIVFSIIILSILFALTSIIFSLKAISIKNYEFVVGGEEKSDILEARLRNVYLDKYWNDNITHEKTIYDFMTDYIIAISSNFNNNQLKGKDIIVSFYYLLASTTFVAISLIMIMLSLLFS